MGALRIGLVLALAVAAAVAANLVLLGVASNHAERVGKLRPGAGLQPALTQTSSPTPTHHEGIDRDD